MPTPWLIVLAGRPGTGKTTLARRLAAELPAVYVRIDAIETALLHPGGFPPPVGPLGYVVAHSVAVSNIGIGHHFVVDAVNPVAQARAGWRGIVPADRLLVFETVVPDKATHRMRVENRRPDLPGQVVPNFSQAQASEYERWDVKRDGPRTVVDMSDTDRGVAQAWAVLAGIRR